jgi:hypothetical protein
MRRASRASCDRRRIVNAARPDGSTALHRAAHHGDVAMAAQVLAVVHIRMLRWTPA